MTRRTRLLRARVAKAERAIQAEQKRQRALSSRLESLRAVGGNPRARSIAKRRSILRALLYGALALIGVVAYQGCIKPRTAFDQDAETRLEASIRDIERRLEQTRVPKEAYEEARARGWALFPPAMGDARDREAYPALRDLLQGWLDIDASDDDVALRWANIGSAACTVGEADLALFSARVLGWLARANEAGLAPVGDRKTQAERARAALLLDCNQHDIRLLTKLTGLED